MYISWQVEMKPSNFIATSIPKNNLDCQDPLKQKLYSDYQSSVIWVYNYSMWWLCHLHRLKPQQGPCLSYTTTSKCLIQNTWSSTISNNY